MKQENSADGVTEAPAPIKPKPDYLVYKRGPEMADKPIDNSLPDGVGGTDAS